jgi:hypothetical protein
VVPAGRRRRRRGCADGEFFFLRRPWRCGPEFRMART